MLELIFRYWGLDWMIFFLVVGNLWLLSSKHVKTAYYLGAVAATLGIGFHYWIGSCGGMVANVTFLCLHLRNVYKLQSKNNNGTSDDLQNF